MQRFPVAKVWIGIDTGGTFTDLVLCEMTSGRYTYHKLPTTTGDPAKAVLDGIAEVIALAHAPRDAVEFLVLGTTLGTNAVLEGAVQASEGQQLTLNYKTGTVAVLVPEGTPMSRSAPGARSDVKPGETIFAVVKPESDGRLVALRVQRLQRILG